MACADVTVILENFYSKTHDGLLQSTDRQLTGAGQQPLNVQGYFVGQLKHKDIKTEQEIFVVHGLSKPLLGRSAIEALAIVSLVEPVMMQPKDIVWQFPKYFKV